MLENLTDISIRFFLKTEVPSMIQIETHVPKNKIAKTQIPIRYLTTHTHTHTHIYIYKFTKTTWVLTCLFGKDRIDTSDGTCMFNYVGVDMLDLD